MNRTRRRHVRRKEARYDPGHDIVSITDDAGIALARTAAPHGIADGSGTVVISGNTVAGYNGSFGGPSVVSPTTFYFGEAYTADGFGGRISWTPS